jgi:peptidoglycan/LPS O-acetylase OafA/YrhL
MQASSISRRNNTKVDSLQALRALAFLGIFLEHASFPYRWPTLGVSIFFVMSGFLMTYRYENVEICLSPKNCFLFSWNKIKKLYPLHILTMLCAVVIPALSIVRNGFSLRPIIELGLKIILNSTLLQTWVPYWTISSSLNNVAWFLSVTMFLYFAFPWLKRLIEQNTVKNLCIISVIILLAEILFCIPLLSILGSRSQIYIWFMYNFPIFRLGDFFIGCVLKRLYFEGKPKSTGMIKATFLELGATALTVLVYFWCAYNHSNVVLKAMCNWTTIYVPIAAVWVLLFAKNQGLLTKLLSNRLSIYIGNISAYAFLIHFIVTMYTPYIVSRMGITVSGWRSTVLVFIELAVSIALSVCYKYIEGKYISKHFFFGKSKSIST